MRGNLNKKDKNRQRYYWPRIQNARGQQKVREAKDYIAALLTNQPDEVVETVVKAAEQIVFYRSDSELGR